MRAIVAAAVVAVACCASATTFTSSASATTYPADCAEGYLCLYEDANWKGKIFETRQSSLGWFSYPPMNRVSSWANRTWSHYFADDRLVSRLAFLYRPIWQMWPRSSDQWVGAESNDRVDRITRSTPIG
ncbi:MAG TPA: peptidase inhibitor family I36 protein [Conexibacter sp.]|nr:peptidase inhibitor family I36 protein [Conexibacter sp.]